MAPQIEPGPILHGSPVAVPSASPTGGTINTSAGPLNWSRAVDGTFTANGNGQQLTITPNQGNQGSKLVFSRVGQAPYLTVQSVMQDSPGSVIIALTGGHSHLTLTLNGFDTAFKSANATVSGSLERPAVMTRGISPSATSVTGPGMVQSPINWTGRVDLTNPLHGPPIPGWPRGAFAAEVTAARILRTPRKNSGEPGSEPATELPGGVAGQIYLG